MVIFHSFLYVYQRVKYIDTSKNSPAIPQPGLMMPEGSFFIINHMLPYWTILDIKLSHCAPYENHHESNIYFENLPIEASIKTGDFPIIFPHFPIASGIKPLALPHA